MCDSVQARLVVHAELGVAGYDCLRHCRGLGKERHFAILLPKPCRNPLDAVRRRTVKARQAGGVEHAGRSERQAGELSGMCALAAVLEHKLLAQLLRCSRNPGQPIQERTLAHPCASNEVMRMK